MSERVRVRRLANPLHPGDSRVQGVDSMGEGGVTTATSSMSIAVAGRRSARVARRLNVCGSVSVGRGLAVDCVSGCCLDRRVVEQGAVPYGGETVDFAVLVELEACRASRDGVALCMPFVSAAPAGADDVPD